ncbi:MAG: 50S ribosomal protein L3 [Spirochaetota bacterium]|nr:50S ribosomal protein L3 [Spirochaetota bacterium]
MSLGLLARKLGMTQVFDENGNLIPVTVLEAGPCYVLEEKSKDKHGYSAFLLGFSDKFKNVNKPQKGFYDKIDVFPKKVLKEFRVDSTEAYKVGDQVKADIFAKGDFVDIQGTTIGRGFQGAIKRHGFHRGPMSHGSRYHRRPGSMGQCADPSRVFKGKKLPGQMGSVNRTIQSLKVVDVNVEENLILVKGSMPGSSNSIIKISKAIKK